AWVGRPRSAKDALERSRLQVQRDDPSRPAGELQTSAAPLKLGAPVPACSGPRQVKPDRALRVAHFGEIGYRVGEAPEVEAYPSTGTEYRHADRAQPDRRVDIFEGARIVAFDAVQGAATQTVMPVLWIEADRDVKVSDRSVELTPDLIDRGPAHIDIRVAGGLFEGDLELLDRSTVVAFADVGGRPVEDGERAGRTDTERGVEIQDRAVVLVLGVVRDAAPDQRVWVLRIEPRGLVVVGDRAVVIALVTERPAAVPEGRGILGVQSKRLGVVPNRTVVVAFAGVGVAPVVEREEEVRMRQVAALDRQRVVRDSAVEILALASLPRLAEVAGSLTQGRRREAEEQSQSDRENQHSPLAERR